MKNVPKNILVAEDRPQLLMIFVRALEGMGYSVVEATNGREALEKLSLGGIDGILSDNQMPEMEGIDLLALVRNDERFKNLPFILTSGDFKVELATKAQELGVNGCLIKPFMPDELESVVRKVFGR